MAPPRGRTSDVDGASLAAPVGQVQLERRAAIGSRQAAGFEVG